MKCFITDIHVHSPYSRATSSNMRPDILSKYAKLKGINLLGTGDILHPEYRRELKKILKERGDGYFEVNEVLFILTTEISLVFLKEGKVRKIHIVLTFPDFITVEKLEKKLSLYGSLTSDGRPTLSLDTVRFIEIIREISKDIMIIPAHIWTPWFSLFGSNSGFDSLEEAFENYISEITALETGLSSDPEMNWMLSSLDKFSLVSNSDSHSPDRIGREANVFKGYLSYKELKEVLEKKDKEKFLFTIEFFPEEGKYHYDGHRNCGISLHPEESKKLNYICPKCGRLLTVGVLSRVYKLADREMGYKPSDYIPYKNLVPLKEIISQAIGKSENTKETEKIWEILIKKFENEINVLMDVTYEEISKTVDSRIALGIKNMREGKVKKIPGYDGVYGIIKVYEDIEVKIVERDEDNEEREPQMSLF
ncbi:MAG: endonuclease Q family protein [candidate division WOR-3 bacterium]